MARFVAIAILIAIGVGVYAFMERSNANTARLQLAKVQGELDLYKKRTGEYTSATKEAQTALVTITKELANSGQIALAEGEEDGKLIY